MVDFPKPDLSTWQALADRETGEMRASSPGRPRGHRGQAAVHGGGPRGSRDRRRPARHPAVSARTARHHVRAAPLDHPPVRRLLHRRGIQRLLPAQPRRRSDRPVGGVRSRDPSRLRQRSSAGRGRRRQGRRGDRHRGGHEAPVRRHPARSGQRVHDHERRRAAGAGVLHRRRRGAGRGARSSSPARSRTTSSRSSWSATPTSTRPDRACASSPT